MIDVFAINTLALMVEQQVAARDCSFFTKRVKDARKSAGYALVLIAILYTTALRLLYLVKTNLIETVNGKEYARCQRFTKWENYGITNI
jgi:cation/acetate symporter